MEFLTAGEKLRKLRQQLDIDQDTLTKIGVSRNFISMLENNKRVLPHNRAIQLAELLRNVAKEKNININISDDYLISTPQEEAMHYCLTALDNLKASDEADTLMEIINKYDLGTVKPRYYLTLADIFFEDKNYTQSFINYLNALDSYKRLNDYIKAPYIYNRLGRCRILKLDYSEGLSYFLKAYESSLYYSDEKIKKISLYNIAWCSYNLNNFDDSLKYINEYLQLCSIENSLDEYMRATILKASCFVKKKDNNSAVSLYCDAVKLFEDLYDPMLGYIYTNLGEISLELGMTKQALDYFEEAQHLREKSDIETVSHTLICKANLYIKINDYTEALLQTLQAIAFAKSFNDTECLLKGYEILEKIYIHLNNYEKLTQVYTDMLTLLNESCDKTLLMSIHAKLAIIDIKNNNIESSLKHLNDIVNIQFHIHGSQNKNT
jgi:transcriptional regulator with XRE-family HTH domain